MFTFLTSGEILDLNHGCKIHSDEDWQRFGDGVRERRNGAFPDEWFDVLKARKRHLEQSNTALESATESQSRTLQTERPSCVPWEELNSCLDDLSQNVHGKEPPAPRCSTLANLSPRPFEQGQTGEVCLGPIASGSEPPQQQAKNSMLPLAPTLRFQAPNQPRTSSQAGDAFCHPGDNGFIWQPQPVVQRVSSA